MGPLQPLTMGLIWGHLFEKVYALYSNFLWGAEEGMGVLVYVALVMHAVY